MKLIYNNKTYTILNGKSYIYDKVFTYYKFPWIPICDASQYLNCTLKIEDDLLVLKRLAVECPKDFDQGYKINGVAPRVLWNWNQMILSYKGLSEEFDISRIRRYGFRYRKSSEEFNVARTITFGTGFMKDVYDKNRKMYGRFRSFSGVLPPYLLWSTNAIWYQKVYEAQIANGKVVKIIDISRDVKIKRKLDLAYEIPLSNPIMKKIAYFSKKWVMENKDRLTDGTEREKIIKAINCLIKIMSTLDERTDIDDAKIKKLIELTSKWIDKYYEGYSKRFKSLYVRNTVRGGGRITKKKLWDCLWKEFSVHSMMFRILRNQLCGNKC